MLYCEKKEHAENVKLENFTATPRENTKRTEMLLKECSVITDETV